jgi:hypothetical protein
LELEQRIKEEIEENPALEEGEDVEDEELSITEQTDNEESTESSNEEFDLSDYFQDDDTPDYRLSANNHSADDEDRENTPCPAAPRSKMPCVPSFPCGRWTSARRNWPNTSSVIWTRTDTCVATS